MIGKVGEIGLRMILSDRGGRAPCLDRSWRRGGITPERRARRLRPSYPRLDLGCSGENLAISLYNEIRWMMLLVGE